ncbi:MAG: VWA domain-containing protein, partial [Anaerolineae bacterium]|nr:VWA domain-containing protein [Anaerolineae bacterium]
NTPAAAQTLSIVSGSENQTLEPLIQQWAKDKGYVVQITYLGSLDIARMLQSGNVPYDAVWPANRLWLDYGDTQNLVHNDQSILRSPVVFGVKRAIAERLGWTTKDVFMKDILEATESGAIRFMMTSATQSNSGASFYFAALSAFAGSPDVLTAKDLDNADVQTDISSILGSVNRSSGSSGWLKTLFMSQYDRYDAMVNYESVIIEANVELEKSGRDPLYAIYPVDGLAIADSPLGYIPHEVQEKEAIFLALQTYLISEPVQKQLMQLGRRTSLLGLKVDNADTAVFRTDWGIDVNRTLQPIRFPTRDVIQQALTLYQIAFRKPSCTAYVLDFSGSMTSNNGEVQLKEAMRTLLNQDVATQYLLQGHPGDVSLVILFNGDVINANELDQWTVEGNDPDELLRLYTQLSAVNADGNTNIFDSTRLALTELKTLRTEDCLPSVIVMTDGQDNAGDWNALQQYINSAENDIPVFVITFGAADQTQLEPIINLTYGRIFNGTSDLVTAFRDAKGYN